MTRQPIRNHRYVLGQLEFLIVVLELVRPRLAFEMLSFERPNEVVEGPASENHGHLGVSEEFGHCAFRPGHVGAAAGCNSDTRARPARRASKPGPPPGRASAPPPDSGR